MSGRRTGSDKDDGVATAFALLAECCRQGFAGRDGERVARLAPGVDWPLFLHLARRHRVEGLAAHALRGAPLVPPEIAAALDGDAARIAADGLANAAECRRLRSAFAGAGLPLMFIKGVTLGRLAYGNPFLKMGWDIDLLIPPGDVGAAAALLAGLGYRLTLPGRGSDAIVPWHRTNKESVWLHEGGRHAVELHSRLADNRRLIPGITVQSPRQIVEVAPGIALPTLARDELFTYLAVHGATSSWFRLKWAADIAGLVNGCSERELAALAWRARQLGAGRCVDQALLLCAALFGAPFDQVPTAASAIDRWLAATSLTYLSGPRAIAEPTEVPFGTAPMHLAHFLLGGSPGYAVGELTRKIVEQVTRRRFSR